MSLQDRLLVTAKLVLDLLVLAAAFVVAFLIRFEGGVPEAMQTVLLASLPLVLFVKAVAFAALGVQRLPWRCVSLVEVRRIGIALLSASLVLTGLRLTAGFAPALDAWQVPLGVLAIDFGLGLLGICGTRATYRLVMEWRDFRRRNTVRGRRVRTLLVGAGPIGVRLASQLLARPDSAIEPLGFVGEGAGKLGMVIHGLPVLGTVEHIRDVIRVHAAEQVLVSASDVSVDLVSHLVRSCENSGVKIKVVPEGAGGGAEGINLARVRDVSIEDLLRRDVVRLGGDGVGEMIRDQTVVVTGAGGSIGSELCRAVCRCQPLRVVLLEQAENGLFNIHRELAEAHPTIELVPCIADVCDVERIDDIFTRFKPAVLFHAAAHKHVPLMEWNPGEAIKNNVLGTRGLADLADKHGVGRFVMVSTDKAVNPTSIMGVAKRVAELYIQALSTRSLTRFVTVRFGNVLGSSGSVIPIFQEQILKGGPVTVTHPEMKRYFMTIPEACQLVLEAAALGHGGEIFILDMGEPVKIVDLARDLIRLAGLVPDKDIKIRFSGIRPGEKLFEELALEDEEAGRTRHPRIYIGKLRPQKWEDLNRKIEELGATAGEGDGTLIRAKFKELVPEYQYSDEKGVGPDRRTPATPGKALRLGSVVAEG